MSKRSARHPGSVVKEVKRNYETKRRCSEEGCHLKMTDVRNHAILKGEEIIDCGKKGDYIIFWQPEELILALVELKSHEPAHPRKIKSQLEACYKKSLEILRAIPNGPSPDKLVFAALAEGWGKTMRIRGGFLLHKVVGRYAILPAKCGVDLRFICRKYARKYRTS